MKKEAPQPVLILHNIRSAFNVGSMFRTADAAGVTKIYLCGYSPTPNDQKVAKTSLGAEKSLEWEVCKHTWRIIEKLKNNGYQVFALEQSKTSKNIFNFNSKSKIALVVGNEVNGLSPKILKYCDETLEIPMYGKKESLNVSVATGIALYQLIRPSGR